MGIVVIVTDIEGVKLGDPDAVKAYEEDNRGRVREVKRDSANL